MHRKYRVIAILCMKYYFYIIWIKYFAEYTSLLVEN